MGLYRCALDSKEMALTLPIVLLAYEWFYHTGNGRPAAWTPKEIAGWLRGPGRVMLYCGALNLVYLYGKEFAPNALMRSPAYRPVLSLQRVFAFETTAMNDLLLAWGSFVSWRGVVAMWVVLAYLAWRRQRPVLRFCWFFLMLTPLPLAVLEGRGAACLYIPLAGWAVFAAVVLTDVAGAVAPFLAEEPIVRRAGYAGLFAAILDTSFIAELWFRDKSLQFHLQRKTPLPPEELAKMTVFDFQDGRLVQVTVPAPLTGGGSPVSY